jgi:hypothetical protein
MFFLRFQVIDSLFLCEINQIQINVVMSLILMSRVFSYKSLVVIVAPLTVVILITSYLRHDAA